MLLPELVVVVYVHSETFKVFGEVCHIGLLVTEEESRRDNYLHMQLLLQKLDYTKQALQMPA